MEGADHRDLPETRKPKEKTICMRSNVWGAMWLAYFFLATYIIRKSSDWGEISKRHTNKHLLFLASVHFISCQWSTQPQHRHHLSSSTAPIVCFHRSRNPRSAIPS